MPLQFGSLAGVGTGIENVGNMLLGVAQMQSEQQRKEEAQKWEEEIELFGSYVGIAKNMNPEQQAKFWNSLPDRQWSNDVFGKLTSTMKTASEDKYKDFQKTWNDMITARKEGKDIVPHILAFTSKGYIDDSTGASIIKSLNKEVKSGAMEEFKNLYGNKPDIFGKGITDEILNKWQADTLEAGMYAGVDKTILKDMIKIDRDVDYPEFLMREFQEGNIDETTLLSKSKNWKNLSQSEKKEWSEANQKMTKIVNLLRPAALGNVIVSKIEVLENNPRVIEEVEKMLELPKYAGLKKDWEDSKKIIFPNWAKGTREAGLTQSNLKLTDNERAIVQELIDKYKTQ